MKYLQIEDNHFKKPNWQVAITSWLFTKRRRVEFGTPNTNPSSDREVDLKPGPPDVQHPNY